MANLDTALGLKLDPKATKFVQDLVKKKLGEQMSSYADDVLPEYVVVMIANNKTGTQVCKDLDTFLGNDLALDFTRWLWQELSSPSVKAILSGKDSTPAVEEIRTPEPPPPQQMHIEPKPVISEPKPYIQQPSYRQQPHSAPRLENPPANERPPRRHSRSPSRGREERPSRRPPPPPPARSSRERDFGGRGRDRRNDNSSRGGGGGGVRELWFGR
mmetsp:Transcript_41456/g.69117  ORF Transcript_41456/g.69117 Transcript_41456/m.69117 type:complete len:215 (+) Transcript_41456:83-727(+)